jgi:hypothetical protein
MDVTNVAEEADEKATDFIVVKQEYFNSELAKNSQILQIKLENPAITPSYAMINALNTTFDNLEVDHNRSNNSVKIAHRVMNPPNKTRTMNESRSAISTTFSEPYNNLSLPSEKPIVGFHTEQFHKTEKYDMCQEIPDTAIPPYSIACLQRIFIKMGGTMKGKLYPSERNINWYNSMAHLGEVKGFLTGLESQMKSKDYETKYNAMINLLGVSKQVIRSPYHQGVEIFWFEPSAEGAGFISRFVRRTISPNIMEAVPFKEMYPTMLQVTDVRKTADVVAPLRVQTNSSFWVSVNQPPSIDTVAFSQTKADLPGLLQDMRVDVEKIYQGNRNTTFSKDGTNIMKMFYNNYKYGQSAFKCDIRNLHTAELSLTCEIGAPFISYEVNLNTGSFEEIRNPGLLGQLLVVDGPDSHVRLDERVFIPGKKGFERMNNKYSVVSLSKIALQSWKTMTFAVRFQSMPVKESVIYLATENCYLNVVATPKNGSTAMISVLHNMKNSGSNYIGEIQLNTWYLFYIYNVQSEFKVYFDRVNDLIVNGGKCNNPFVALKQNYIVGQQRNAVDQRNTTIILGTKNCPSLTGSSAFVYDLLWIHLFDIECEYGDIYRECLCNWIYTEYMDF